MNCPSCVEVVLAMSNRDGIEIDYCPRCRGVWLDRGELDKLVERAEERVAATAGAGRAGPGRTERYDDDDRYDADDRRSDWDDDRRRAPRRKKKSFLSDLFEFGE